MRRTVLVLLLLAACKKSAERAASPPDDKAGVRQDKGNGIVGGSAPAPGNSPIQDPSGDGRPIDLDRILTEDFTTVGDIDKSTVRSTVKAHLAKLQVCYEKTLLANPGIEGKCVVTFKVGVDGNVREAKASGVHPEVETCVADVIKSFKFPASTAETEVSYPFTFRSN